MALLAIPRGIRSIDWTPPQLAQYASKSSYSGKATIIDRGGVTSGFAAKVSVSPTADLTLWRAFAMRARDKTNVFRLPAVTPGKQAAAPATIALSGSGVAVNYLLQNGALANAVWSPTGLASVALTTSPSPTGAANDAFIAFESTANSQHSLTQSAAGGSGNHVFSISAKYLNRRYLMLVINNGAFAVFDLINGVVVQTVSATAGMIPDDFGFYRCWVAAAGASLSSVTIAWGTTGTTAAIIAGYPGAIGAGVILWRPQAEVGQLPSPMVPTTTTVAASLDALVVSGLAGNTMVMKAGQLVSFYDRLHVLQQDVLTDGTGIANMSVAPPLGAYTIAGNFLYGQQPFCRMRLVSQDVAWADQIGYGQPAEFTCEEAL